MSTHNICFVEKKEEYQNLSDEETLLEGICTVDSRYLDFAYLE